jgi:ATP-dependent Lhr-like helicase
VPPLSHPLPFHPLTQTWFTARYGTPTDVQARAWPVIASGAHALITAPTGSGKTLTAFLFALDRLLTGAIPAGAVRVLYISPLKALNTDIRRNLETPLAELLAAFEAAGLKPPAIRVAVRSGDTPAEERARMLRRPPEILITTPESLNILLISRRGRALLEGVQTLLLDEVHAVAGSKRGTHLALGIERLARVAGEFQRVALSATVRPLETIAAFVGGHQWVSGTGEEAMYRPRPVTIVRSASKKVYDLAVRSPAEKLPEEDDPEVTIWDLLTPELKTIIRSHRSTLVFVNSRRQTEKLTRMLNADERRDLAYSHHGSLAREVRQVVEERLKRGELPAIVATNSLELGIDIGALDEVVLVGTPRSVASAVQRVGRAGHGVGEVSKGTFYPLFGRDFLDAAVVAKAVLEGEIEDVVPIREPLDVLAQAILALVAQESFGIDELYDHLRTAEPYRHLKRRHFELVLEMLAGRYADTRLRELKPRVRLDRVTGTVVGREGTDRLLYLSGGTIPDRGYYHLKVAGSNARLGELDEEFVWERSVGDTFTFGTQIWRVQKITHNDVLVEPGAGSAAMAPFWRSESEDRGFFLSERIGRFLAEAEPEVDRPEFVTRLTTELCFDSEAAHVLQEFLSSQKAALGGILPHRQRVVFEHVATDRLGRPDAPDRQRVAIHALWGGRSNRPLAIALAAAWEAKLGGPVEVESDDDCLMIAAPEAQFAGLSGREILGMVARASLEELLRERLEATGFFGAHFRQNAGRALLLPKAGFKSRTPLWLHRQRAKNLLDAVGRYGDFPLVLETWRTCLADEFDLETLKRLLAEVENGEIEIREVWTSAPSPFAANLMWAETNRLMYEDDVPGGEGKSKLSGTIRQELLAELVHAGHLRPRLDPALCEELRRKLQRSAPGYAPRDGGELLEWVRERVFLPEPEWRELLAAAREVDLEPLAGRASWLTLPGGSVAGLVAVEALPRLARILGVSWDALTPLEALTPLDALTPTPLPRGGRGAQDSLREVVAGLAAEPVDSGEAGDPAADLLLEWLRFYGPVQPSWLEAVFGPMDRGFWAEALEALSEDGRVVIDELTRGAAGVEICDAQNLEILLRWTRSAGRPTFQALPLARLPLFLAAHQGLAPRGDDLPGLERRLESLIGWSAPAEAWEELLLPARMEPYLPSWLDGVLQASPLAFVGTGKERLTFAFPDDLGLLKPPPAPAGTSPAAAPEGEGGHGGPPRRQLGPAATGGHFGPPLRKDDRPGSAFRAAAALVAAGVGGGEMAAAPAEPGVDSLFPDRRGRYSLFDLVQPGTSVASVTERLWDLVWAGQVTNDSFESVRKGIPCHFRPSTQLFSSSSSSSSPPTFSRRSGFNRWRAAQPADGLWRALPVVDSSPLDALEEEELWKARARLLLDRHGVVFRELLARELPVLQGGRIFRALRLMELSGEVLAGQFFDGVPGLQFASPAAFRRLKGQDGWPDDVVFWLNATDPASLCGIDLPEWKSRLPERRPGNGVVFHGERLVASWRQGGKQLHLEVGPDHPRLAEYLGFLKTFLTRAFQPESAVAVAEVNGAGAASSPYAAVLRREFAATAFGDVLTLRRRY